MIRGLFLIAGTGALIALGPTRPAYADSARITGLSDIDFGAVTNASDQSSSQSVVICSYKNNPQRLQYSVTANGSGTGSAFTLSSGAALLPYDVQWADSAGQTGGTLLQPGTPAGGFGNGATGFACPAQGVNATLTVTIRSGDIAAAPAGTYVGTLQLLVAPQ